LEATLGVIELMLGNSVRQRERLERQIGKLLEKSIAAIEHYGQKPSRKNEINAYWGVIVLQYLLEAVLGIEGRDGLDT